MECQTILMIDFQMIFQLKVGLELHISHSDMGTDHHSPQGVVNLGLSVVTQWLNRFPKTLVQIILGKTSPFGSCHLQLWPLCGKHGLLLIRAFNIWFQILR